MMLLVVEVFVLDTGWHLLANTNTAADVLMQETFLQVI